MPKSSEKALQLYSGSQNKYVYGRDFAIQTDHRPLIGLLKEDKLITPLASPKI